MGYSGKKVWNALFTAALLAIVSGAVVQEALAQNSQVVPGAESSATTTTTTTDGVALPTGTTTDSGAVTSVSTTSTLAEEPTETITDSATSTLDVSTTTTPTITADGALQTVNVTRIPIVPATFSPFPIPVESSVPGLFVNTDPSDPPPVRFPPDLPGHWVLTRKVPRQVGSRVVPNFGPASAKFSLEEKVNVTTGVGWTNGRCVHRARGFPGLCLEDSPLGVRFADFVSAFPAGINAAASWNRDLMRLRGLSMGQQFKGKGAHIALGPMMNMGRVPQGGRNWEGFGADPFLAGEAAYETVLGLQQGGTQACAKHLINNEQEYKRSFSSSEHEVYLHPFLRSIMAGAATIMCSYNLINGTRQRRIGFQGREMSMPGDITFNSGNSYWGANLTAYVQNGTIPEARVDDMATRILAGYFLTHQDQPSFPPVNFDAFKPDDQDLNEHIDVQTDAHEKLVRDLGAASVVLLKNERGALPLGGNHATGKKAERDIVVVGSDAGPGRAGPNQFADQGGSDGILAMGWGSGTTNFTYLITPLDAIQRRARKTRTSCLLDPGRLQPSTDSGEEYINVDGNGGDRKNLTAWHSGDDLVLAVAAQNNNTIVVVNSVGPLIIDRWVEHENVTAVVWAGLQGNEAGNAIADVLYGEWNPSGKLPYTIAKKVEDYGVPDVVRGNEGQLDILRIDYTEGLQIDYRSFDARKVSPRYEFGYGLSYTTFNYSGLSISKIQAGGFDKDLIQAWERGKATPQTPGISRSPWLHTPAYDVSFTVTNTGGVLGGDIPQVYLHLPTSANAPPSVLKGFTNIELRPGQSKRITIPLSRYDLSIWDVTSQGWRKANAGGGTVGLSVGQSSRDFKVKGTVPV
ncbi:cellulose-binding beta-glucosidase [Ephemerocybe angulata]|uniref:beta-glucosidase n=1 Tax=Ephemerocybe angulata TaxID=980116 RepID=A0A8H6HM20_9AGAR|nr:cellulose-binding beta-glucosidase [Tulosesus angulatus]